ncbi:hypothetical protein J3A76_007337 [Methylobacterium sp. PvP109]|uniref:Uncharacterized protein n=1 Tax=Methylobacterium radiotolerans TaxID=31998 RepID=A0ABV2NTQ6_9HYPH|nr:hypothetical protein [Methylobacterium sp. PvP109]
MTVARRAAAPARLPGHSRAAGSGRASVSSRISSQVRTPRSGRSAPGHPAPGTPASPHAEGPRVSSLRGATRGREGPIPMRGHRSKPRHHRAQSARPSCRWITFADEASTGTDGLDPPGGLWQQRKAQATNALGLWAAAVLRSAAREVRAALRRSSSGSACAGAADGSPGRASTRIRPTGPLPPASDSPVRGRHADEPVDRVIPVAEGCFLQAL